MYHLVIDMRIIRQLKLHWAHHKHRRELIKQGMHPTTALYHVCARSLYKKRAILLNIFTEIQATGEDLHANCKDFETLFITKWRENDLEHQQREIQYILNVIRITDKRRKNLIENNISSRLTREEVYKQYLLGENFQPPKRYPSKALNSNPSRTSTQNTSQKLNSNAPEVSKHNGNVKLNSQNTRRNRYIKTDKDTSLVTNY